MRRDVVVIGASAGGIESLVQIMGGLPADFPAAVAVVLHVPPDNPSVLPRILARSGALPCDSPRDRQRLEPGRVYVARPDHHLLIRRGHFRVTRGPRENGFRPAVDPLFRTAALAYGPRVIGVVLSGNLDDGTVGLAMVQRHGGVTMVQDPADANYPGMPASAIAHVHVNHIAPASEIADLLTQLVHEEIAEEGVGAVTDDASMEADVAEMDETAVHNLHRPGEPAGFGCPECGGALFVVEDAGPTHFRCRVGHAWSPDSLLAAQGDTLEAALWTALRALEESVALSVELANRMRRRSSRSARRFEDQAQIARYHANVIREVLQKEQRPSRANSEIADEIAAEAEANGAIGPAAERG